MDRTEMYMVETYKCEELKKRLKPITDWTQVEKEELIYHEDSNSIYSYDKFLSLNEEGDILSYLNSENKIYTRSITNWYYYDESIADEVEEYFTPKLYVVNSVKYKEDIWFIVSFNEKYLKRDFLKAMRFDDMSDDKFFEKYEYEVLKNVNGFKIVLQ